MAYRSRTALGDSASWWKAVVHAAAAAVASRPGYRSSAAVHLPGVQNISSDPGFEPKLWPQSRSTAVTSDQRYFGLLKATKTATKQLLGKEIRDKSRAKTFLKAGLADSLASGVSA